MNLNRDRIRNLFGRLLIHLVLLAGVIWSIFPFVWMVFTSLKSYWKIAAIPKEKGPPILPDGTSASGSILQTLISSGNRHQFCCLCRDQLFWY